MVPRERFSHTERSLESIFDNTVYPFDMVYVDGNAPPRVAAYLRKASGDKGFLLIRSERYLSPNAARNIGLAASQSDYVVFIDNDCEVEPGWLTHLVQCATETGAWAVAPLYFQGRSADRVIHMAGGTARILDVAGKRAFKSNHALAHRLYQDVGNELHRAETELFEFHCVLLKTQALRQLGGLDEAYLSAHEHEDLSLLIRNAGGRIYLEPASRVTYAFGALDRFDADYARLRWSDDWNRKSTSHFREKWQLHEDWGTATVEWCNDHRRRLLRETRSVPNVLRRGLKRVLRRFSGRQGSEWS